MAKQEHAAFEASFITLAMSLASAAAMGLGLAPNPQTHKTEKDVNMARFNIDMLDILQQKTKGNLTQEEADFMKQVLADLKLKFVEVSKNEGGKK